jgi:hypothetical protein
MTSIEFDKIRPGKTIVSVNTNEGNKTMLVKFFCCNTENYDGYWLCCTEDMTNPYPHVFKDEDWNVYINNAEIISL